MNKLKVVVLDGSPHNDGKTKSIVNEVLRGLDVDTHFYNAYKNDIAACIDCSYCFNHESECVIIDDFQLMINDLMDADVVILSSPLHFSTYSGKFLSMISRFQCLFALKYHFKKELPFKNKIGLVVCSAGNNYPKMFDALHASDRIIFDHLNVTESKRLCLNQTDKYSMEELLENNKDEINQIKEYLKAIN